MKRIALTGGIATGKSHVLSVLHRLDIPTVDADTIVHEELGRPSPIAAAIAREFGSETLWEDGSVDRASLGSRIFGDAASRLRLEAIVHPVVYSRIEDWFDTQAGKMGVACIPLLYETHHEGDFDAVIVTACGSEQQLERLMARGLSAEDARRRIDAQMPTEEKVRRADYVIWTTETKDETDRQVEQVVKKLLL